MQQQKWTRRARIGRETITVHLKETRIKRGRKLIVIQAIHKATSDKLGQMLPSSPMVRDIQEAINLGRSVSRVYGFRKEK